MDGQTDSYRVVTTSAPTFGPREVPSLLSSQEWASAGRERRPGGNFRLWGIRDSLDLKYDVPDCASHEFSWSDRHIWQEAGIHLRRTGSTGSFCFPPEHRLPNPPRHHPRLSSCRAAAPTCAYSPGGYQFIHCLQKNLTIILNSFKGLPIACCTVPQWWPQKVRQPTGVSCRSSRSNLNPSAPHCEVCSVSADAATAAFGSTVQWRHVLHGQGTNLFCILSNNTISPKHYNMQWTHVV